MRHEDNFHVKVYATMISLAVVMILSGVIAYAVTDEVNTCIGWSSEYDLDPEVCWGYGEDERAFAPANEELTENEFNEIVTRFYENR